MFRFRSSRAIVMIAALVVAAAAAATFVSYRVSRDSADGLLRRADKLSWNNSWIEAAPLYAQAEQMFVHENKPSRALYAHVSQFIPRAEWESIPDLLLELQNDLGLPAARDPETKLRILVIKGMIETNYDAGMAHQTWAQVETLAKARHHYLLAARAMGEEGIAAFLLGDLASAKKQVVSAWAIAKYLHDPAAHVRYASVYGAGLNELGRYNEALGPLNEAIHTATSTRGIAYPSIAIDSKIDALRGLHRYDEALSLADEAIRRLPGPHFDAHLYELLSSKGEIYKDMGRCDDAIREYDDALGYARRLKLWRGISLTGGLLAQAYEQENRLDMALSAINEAIAANKQIPKELYYVPRNLAIQADIMERMGQRQKAHALYQKSADLIDSLIATAPTPNVERMLLTELSNSYSGYFEALCDEKNYAGAFETIEKARGRIEAQSLEHHEVIVPHRPTPEEQRITALNVKLIDSDDPQVRSQLTQAIYDAELDVDTPPLAGHTATDPVPLKQIQRDLDSSSLVIEYVLAEPHSYALAITRQSVNSYPLEGRKAIEASATKYLGIARSQKTAPDLAQSLFSELLRPIPEYSNHSFVVIVPDGNLHMLPFSALMDGKEYAITTHTFSTSPSATVLHILRARELATRADPLPYVGVAAWTQVVEHKNPILRAISGPERSQLEPLPDSQKEVETIATDLPKPDTILLGSDATETNFKRLPLESYSVLHLALHGYADVEYPDRSALVFAPEEKGPDDGLLQVREIRNLHLNADLVTLSACNTGVGPVGEEGVANLGNAFIEAGAETVVSTLWELEDQTTARLMMSFYGNLARHQSKVEALRAAQLDFVHAGLPPYYWAGFEIVGDPNGTVR